MFGMILLFVVLNPLLLGHMLASGFVVCNFVDGKYTNDVNFYLGTKPLCQPTKLIVIRCEKMYFVLISYVYSMDMTTSLYTHLFFEEKM